MGAIRILAPSVRDQIAAGEVVERPVSVVKELLENSLDAGATVVKVRVTGGGKSGIWVRDNGVGMDREDLVLSVQRHATSKLTVLDDLTHSYSLGFRGEALAAIAAVSRIAITSRPKDAAFGHRLVLHANAEPELKTQAAPPGTTVEVDDLFYSVPARLKHLKTDAVELLHIQQLVSAMALAYPHVRFRLETPERSLLEVPGRGEMTDVMLAAYGREVAGACVAVAYENADGSVSIRGVAAPAAFSRSTRSGETLVVNGRVIQNWTLRSALEEAYRPEIGDRRFPIACLRVTLPGERLDPNVHPQKSEVRIDGERQVAALIHRAVREALAAQSGSGPFWPNALPKPGATGSLVDAEPQTFSQIVGYAMEEGAEANPAGKLAREIFSLSPLGQWAQKYIVAQGSLGLYLIDQHAAHERVYYEKFRREFERSLASQLLLVPLSLTLGQSVAQTLEKHRRELEHLGFDWTVVGQGTVLVRAVPAALADPHLNDEQLSLTLTGFTQPQGEHPWADAKEAAAMAACKTAIKAYRRLQAEEIQELLRQLAACEDPRSCPHGRPTLLHFTMEEVDRRFGRKG